jgi:hypothetical protein
LAKENSRVYVDDRVSGYSCNIHPRIGTLAKYAKKESSKNNDMMEYRTACGRECGQYSWSLNRDKEFEKEAKFGEALLLRGATIGLLSLTDVMLKDRGVRASPGIDR